MKQTTLGLDWTIKRTRKRKFLVEINRVVPRVELVALVEPHSPRAKTGRPPFPIEMTLRTHLMKDWFTFGDQAMEEALVDAPLYRNFAGLNLDAEQILDSIRILWFGHLFERHGLALLMFAMVNEMLAAKGLTRPGYRGGWLG